MHSRPFSPLALLLGNALKLRHTLKRSHDPFHYSQITTLETAADRSTRTASGNALEAYMLVTRCWGLYLRYVEGTLQRAHRALTTH